MYKIFALNFHFFRLVLLVAILFTINTLNAQTESDTLINKIQTTVNEQYRDFVKQQKAEERAFADSIRKAEKERKKFVRDSIRIHGEWQPDPKKATLWALLPSAGQCYNRKYWKMPIVYAGFGTITYLIIHYSHQYRDWKNAYLFKVTDGERGRYNHYADVYDASQLAEMKEFYQSNREWCYFAGIVFYVLQILDASVDAHLYNFNVSKDLSLRLAPQTPLIPENIPLRTPTQNVGFTLSYHIGN